MAEPLNRFRVMTSGDLGEVRHCVSALFCEHFLHPLSATPRGDAIVNHADLQATSWNWVDYGRAVRIDPEPFQRFFLLQIIMEGSARITGNGVEKTICAGEASLIAPSEKVVMDWSQDCRKAIIRIEKQSLERFAEQWAGDITQGELTFDRHLDWTGDRYATLRNLVYVMQADIEADTGVFRHAFAQKRFEETLFSALLLTQPSNLSRILERTASPTTPRAVRDAQAYIEEHADEDITISDLVRVADISARTLYDSFRKYKGVTPMYYLRRYRLSRVREDLLKADSNESVTDIAMRWNFEQLGRFANFYRSIYGEKPSETLRRRQ